MNQGDINEIPICGPVHTAHCDNDHRYTFTLESGFPDEAIKIVLESIRNSDKYVGEMRPIDLWQQCPVIDIEKSELKRGSVGSTPIKLRIGSRPDATACRF